MVFFCSFSHCSFFISNEFKNIMNNFECLILLSQFSKCLILIGLRWRRETNRVRCNYRLEKFRMHDENPSNKQNIEKLSFCILYVLSILQLLLLLLWGRQVAGSLALSVWIRWPRATMLNRSFGFGQLKYRLSFNYNAGVASKTNFMSSWREI